MPALTPEVQASARAVAAEIVDGHLGHDLVVYDRATVGAVTIVRLTAGRIADGDLPHDEIAPGDLRNIAAAIERRTRHAEVSADLVAWLRTYAAAREDRGAAADPLPATDEVAALADTDSDEAEA